MASWGCWGLQDLLQRGGNFPKPWDLRVDGCL